MPTDHDHKSTLAHALWIGGATDAGKTTVAKLLAKRHGLDLYHCEAPEQAELAQPSKRSSVGDPDFLRAG